MKAHRFSVLWLILLVGCAMPSNSGSYNKNIFVPVRDRNYLSCRMDDPISFGYGLSLTKEVVVAKGCVTQLNTFFNQEGRPPVYNTDQLKRKNVLETTCMSPAWDSIAARCCPNGHLGWTYVLGNGTGINQGLYPICL